VLLPPAYLSALFPPKNLCALVRCCVQQHQEREKIDLQPFKKHRPTNAGLLVFHLSSSVLLPVCVVGDRFPA
jgi:hypothetical protein